MRDTTLVNFVLRVKRGEDFGKEITPEVLEYIADGVLRHLEGSKTPWPKKRGRNGTPSKKDYQVWFDYKTSILPKIRGGDLLSQLMNEYDLSESGVLDSVRRVQAKAIQAEQNSKNSKDDETNYEELYFLLILGHEALKTIEEKNYFIIEKAGSSN
jgi:hypothetical protein